jgi:hypothetical protein
MTLSSARPTISATATSASQSPPLTNPFDTTHFYNTPGNLLATLDVTTQHGCTENYTDTIQVWQTPHPLISTSGNFYAQGSSNSRATSSHQM